MMMLASKYNMSSAAPSPLPVGAGVGNGAVTTTPGSRSFLDPQNPEIWLVGIGALMLGFISVSTSVKGIGSVKLGS